MNATCSEEVHKARFRQHAYIHSDRLLLRMCRLCLRTHAHIHTLYGDRNQDGSIAAVVRTIASVKKINGSMSSTGD